MRYFLFPACDDLFPYLLNVPFFFLSCLKLRYLPLLHMDNLFYFHNIVILVWHPMQQLVT